MAASRRSRAVLRPQRPRHTEVETPMCRIAPIDAPCKPYSRKLVSPGLAGHIFLGITREKAHLFSASFSNNRRPAPGALFERFFWGGGGGLVYTLLGTRPSRIVLFSTACKLGAL